MSMRRKVKGLGIEQIKAIGKAQFDAPVTMDDFEQALAKIQSSVNEGDIAKHKAWVNEFGSA